MTRLSANLNKIALIRNSRASGLPSVLGAARTCIAAGARGITVHPRPDERHIRKSDVLSLAELLHEYPQIELNIEGNPFPDFIALVKQVKPAQVTLVPDSPAALTSDHGWDLEASASRLGPILTELRTIDVRVSLFMDAEADTWGLAKSLGADRIELFTEPYAQAFGRPEFDRVFAQFGRAARAAQSAGLGVNAGHDLSLENLAKFCEIPEILEVSIGHALVADALEMGLSAAVSAYVAILAKTP